MGKIGNNQKFFINGKDNSETFWEYVICNFAIIELNLSNNNLGFLFDGENDKPFEKFEVLEVLNLANNNIEQVSIDFSKLKSLKVLDLSGNGDIKFLNDSIYNLKNVEIIGVEIKQPKPSVENSEKNKKEKTNSKIIPEGVHGKWYISKNTILELVNSDEFNLEDFIQSYLKAVEFNDTDSVSEMKETINILEKNVGANFLLSSKEIISPDFDETGNVEELNIISIEDNGNKIKILAKEADGTDHELVFDKDLLTMKSEKGVLTFSRNKVNLMEDFKKETSVKNKIIKTEETQKKSKQTTDSKKQSDIIVSDIEQPSKYAKTEKVQEKESISDKSIKKTKEDSNTNDLVQYGTYQISKKELEYRKKKKEEYIAKKLEIKKVYRKFKQKTMFGSKEIDGIFIEFKGHVYEDNIFLNGNYYSHSSSSIKRWFTEKQYDCENNNDINWLVFGLVEKKFSSLDIPEIDVRCYLNDSSYSKPYSGKLLCIKYPIAKWLDGVNKFAYFHGLLYGGVFNGLIYEGDKEYSEAIKKYELVFKIPPSDFIHGYYIPSLYGDKNVFLGKEFLSFGSYNKIDIIQANIGDYIIIEDEESKMLGFRLIARYLSEYYYMTRSLIENCLSEDKNNGRHNLRVLKSVERNDYLGFYTPKYLIEKKVNEAKEWFKNDNITDGDVKSYIDNLYKDCYELSKITLCLQHIPTMKDYFVDWHDIIWDYERFGIIEVGKPYELPGVFKINKVKSIQILEDYKFIPKITEVFNFDIEPRLGITQDIHFSFSKVDDRDFALEFFEHIKNKEFFEKLVKVKNLYRDCYIEGYYNILELKELFNNVQGNATLPQNKEVTEHLKYLQLFYEYVVDNIKDSSERELLTNALKNIINNKAQLPKTKGKTKGLLNDSIDFSVDDRLGINLTIAFEFNTKDEQKAFHEIKESLESGLFYAKIEDISKLRRKGYIQGYYNYLELKELFNNIQGDSNFPDDKRVKDSFEFLINIQHNLIDKTESEDAAVLLVNMIKLLIND